MTEDRPVSTLMRQNWRLNQVLGGAYSYQMLTRKGE
jgi:hypothetical protein